MAEKLSLVCDICGAPATETVSLRSSSGNRQKDLCAQHLQDLLRGSRVPKRGRKPGAVKTTVASTPHRRKASTTSSTTRRKKTSARKSPSRKKTTARKTATRRSAVAATRTGTKAGYSKNGKRLGRPPGSGAKKAAARKQKTSV